MRIHLKLFLTLACLIISSAGHAEIEGTDDFRVNVQTGVEDTRFESDRMDLTKGKDAQKPSSDTGILLNSPSAKGFTLLETENQGNTLPDPVSSRRRVRESNALIQSASAPVLAPPSAIETVEDSEAGGGLFWAIVAGVGLVFIVLLLLLKSGGGDNNDSDKKRSVQIR